MMQVVKFYIYNPSQVLALQAALTTNAMTDTDICGAKEMHLKRCMENKHYQPQDWRTGV